MLDSISSKPDYTKNQTEIKKVSSEAQSSDRSNFSAKLSNVIRRDWNESLDRLISAIEEQAKSVAKRRTFLSVKKYRELVGQFVKEFSCNNQDLMKKESKRENGDTKIYVTLNTINKKVDELMTDVLDSQVDNLVILEKLDEVRGLLVDLRG